MLLSRGENAIFTPETCERRTADQRESTQQESKKCDWHFFLKATHFPNVLLMMQTVYLRTGSEEQQGLERGVSEQMKHRCLRRSQPDRGNHQTQLRKGRVGEHSFDVSVRGGH